MRPAIPTVFPDGVKEAGSAEYQGGLTLQVKPGVLCQEFGAKGGAAA